MMVYDMKLRKRLNVRTLSLQQRATLQHSNNGLSCNGNSPAELQARTGLVTTGANSCAIWDYSIVGNYAGTRWLYLWNWAIANMDHLVQYSLSILLQIRSLECCKHELVRPAGNTRMMPGR